MSSISILHFVSCSYCCCNSFALLVQCIPLCMLFAISFRWFNLHVCPCRMPKWSNQHNYICIWEWEIALNWEKESKADRRIQDQLTMCIMDIFDNKSIRFGWSRFIQTRTKAKHTGGRKNGRKKASVKWFWLLCACECAQVYMHIPPACCCGTMMMRCMLWQQTARQLASLTLPKGYREAECNFTCTYIINTCAHEEWMRPAIKPV